MVHDWNQDECAIPVSESEIDGIFNSVWTYYQRRDIEQSAQCNQQEQRTESEQEGEQEQEQEEQKEGEKPEEKLDKKNRLVATASRTIMKRYNFITIEETKEILYYKDGVYLKGGSDSRKSN